MSNRNVLAIGIWKTGPSASFAATEEMSFEEIFKALDYVSPTKEDLAYKLLYVTNGPEDMAPKMKTIYRDKMVAEVPVMCNAKHNHDEDEDIDL